MADITAHEKQVFENLFEMNNTTVLDMDRDEFIFFVSKYIHIELDHFEEYHEDNSADLFRKMWEVETDYTISVVLKHLLEWYLKHKYYEIDDKYSGEFDDSFYSERLNIHSECKRISNQLMFNDFYDLPKRENTQLEILSEDIRESLGRGVPQLIIDRLHTFSLSLLRDICNSHSIDIKDENNNFYPITSLIGMLVKYYDNNNFFESGFISIAIKSSVSVFEQFNKLRNDKSFAHPNAALNNMETEYALRSIINTLNFIDDLERKLTYDKVRKDIIVKNDDNKQPFNIH